MADHAEASERALDQPGSADESTIRGGLTFALLILVFALGVVLFGVTIIVNVSARGIVSRFDRRSQGA